MIKFFLYTLLAILAGLVVTLFLARDPGYLLISFGNYTFETSLFALLVALLFILFFARLLFLLIDWLNPFHLVSYGRAWSTARAKRRLENAQLPFEQQEKHLLEDLLALRSSAEKEAIPLPELRKLWRKRVRDFATSDDVLCAYVDVLVLSAAMGEAISTLEMALDKNWSGRLIRRYSLLALRTDDVMAGKQLQRAEQWLQYRRSDAALLLALGRLSLRARLWGKAKEYFERSLRSEADAEVFAELARLLQNLKEPEKNPSFLRQHIKAVSTALPNFPQP